MYAHICAIPSFMRLLPTQVLSAPLCFATAVRPMDCASSRITSGAPNVHLGGKGERRTPHWLVQAGASTISRVFSHRAHGQQRAAVSRSTRPSKWLPRAFVCAPSGVAATCTQSVTSSHVCRFAKIQRDVRRFLAFLASAPPSVVRGQVAFDPVVLVVTFYTT